MAKTEVPDVVIGRLPIYLRELILLSQSEQEFTSSKKLGQRLGVGSTQIRKDLSHFGEFGKQGTGYEIEYLQDQISKILHVDRDWAVGLVGFGDLGQAIANYAGFADEGFYIKVVFDNNPEKIGLEINGKTVHDIAELSEIITKQEIKIAIIAIPVSEVQEIADKLIEAGVRAILCYASLTLNVPDTVRVQYVDPIAHLQRMTYYLA